MIQAIVYTSNTGSTERYAKLLGHETDLSVYSLEEAKKTLKSGAQIIYLGWIMAGGIQGYVDAARRFEIPMVCAVGMEPAGKQQPAAEISPFRAQGRFSRSCPSRQRYLWLPLQYKPQYIDSEYYLLLIYS